MDLYAAFEKVKQYLKITISEDQLAQAEAIYQAEMDQQIEMITRPIKGGKGSKNNAIDIEAVDPFASEEFDKHRNVLTQDWETPNSESRCMVTLKI